MNEDVEVANAPMGGYVREGFEEVRDCFERSLGDGSENGASVGVSIDGEMVVDLWGGWADEERTRPWTSDTIVNVYSVNKTMMAITALFLADRGVIDFDAPVASYWPEFAQGGKGEIPVRYFMSHSSGLSGWKEPMELKDIYDWDKATTLLARQEPFWEPGTAPGYHGFTQGYLVGEVVRRATGEMLADIFRREIAEPLGADFQLTLDPSDYDRTAIMTPPDMSGPIPEPTELMMNIAVNPPIPWECTRTAEWKGAHIYAAAGHGNGRSIAKIHALLANGGEVNGKRLMSEAGCRKAMEFQIEGMDLVLGMPARFGMGFGLPGEWLPTPHDEVIFWPGAGGALTVIDLKSRMSFGYAMNRMERGLLVNPRAHELLKASWNALQF